MTEEDTSPEVGRLLYVLDLLLLAFAYLLSYNLQVAVFPDSAADLKSHLVLLPVISLVFVWGMTYGGAYKRLKISLMSHAWVVASSLLFAIGALFTILFLLQQHWLSRLILGVFVLTVFFLVVVIRAIFVWWYFSRTASKIGVLNNVLIVGAGERAAKITELVLSESEWGTKIVGYVDINPQAAGSMFQGRPILGAVDNIEEVLAQNVVDEVIIAVPRSMIALVGKIFNACEEQGVKIRLMADIFDFRFARMRLDVLGGVPLLNFEPVAQDEAALLIKRIFDIAAVLLAAPILLPFLLLVALAVKLDSKGPVFFVQQRVGLRKRQFPMYKFRSMVVDAEAKLAEIEHLNEAQGPNFKIAHDPRITRVGRIIRKTSIDELPQLLNVLLGHMSIVGPRPMSLRDVELFDRGIQRKRFSVRPGLTCIWQVSGRSNLTFDQWLELDLKYIDNWSLRLDFEILLKTVPVLLKAEGAV